MGIFRDVFYLLIAVAVIPAIVLLCKVYQADKAEKEPPLLLLSLVGWGILATFAATVTERLGISLLNSLYPAGGTTHDLLLYFIIVAGSEEGFKYLVLKRKTWRHPAFNYLFDGVVYAVFVSLGFALWENILYSINYGFGTALIRAITAVPGHACFGVFMGVWYSFAKNHENAGRYQKAKISRVLAVIFPMLLHGAYDYVASSQLRASFLVFLIFIVLMFYVSFRLVKRISAEDRPNGQNRWN